MKHVLFIAYLFPPIANSGTQRPLKFVKYLQHHDWLPTVLTAADYEGHPLDDALMNEIPESVDIVRVPMLQQRVARAFRRVLGPAVGGRIGDAIAWRVQRRYRTPDWYALWQPTATRAAIDIFRKKGFDAIVATGFPWTSLLVGAAISRATGRPLIADFRDLWSGEAGFTDDRAPHPVEAVLERRVIEQAARVVGSSASITRWLSRAYPGEPEDKFIAIHNGFDPADLHSAAPAAARRRAFRIVYTGVWKKDYNPLQLYESLGWLRRSQPQLLEGVEVIVAGSSPGEAQRRGLGDVITEVGWLPHAEAVATMQSADVLYLPHGDPDRQWAIPGKLYEYLATGRPILALTHPDHETAQILRAVGGGVVVSPEDPGELYRALGDILREKHIHTPPRDAAALARFERRALTARLAGALDQIYTTRSSRADSSAGSPTRSSYAGASSAQPATRVVS